eukprot:g43248.t1
MAANDPLDVDASGVENKDQRNPIKEQKVTAEMQEHLVKRKKEAYLRRKQGSDRDLEGYMVAKKELKNGFRRARRGCEKALV